MLREALQKVESLKHKQPKQKANNKIKRFYTRISVPLSLSYLLECGLATGFGLELPRILPRLLAGDRRGESDGAGAADAQLQADAHRSECMGT